MMTEIELYNMDSYVSFDDARASGAIYTTKFNSQDDTVIAIVLDGMATAVKAIDSNAQYDYRIIKYSF